MIFLLTNKYFESLYIFSVNSVARYVHFRGLNTNIIVVCRISVNVPYYSRPHLRVAKKQWDHQEMLTGDGIHKKIHAHLQLAAENHYFDDRAPQIIVNTRNIK